MHNDSVLIHNASENNLRSISLSFPKNKLVVVTGVSGSGKSSLVFDVIYREAESRYLGSFSSYARQFLGRMKRPNVERVEGLSPAIAVDQKSVLSNPRSTVGTITEIYDYLRLLFARLGKPENNTRDFRIERSLFSFNSPAGACPACKGLGVEDRLDPDLLIADKNKSLRQGCMVITAPNGYIIYSQVTMDVLDEVCRAEGFNADIPWKDLTPEQRHIVLYGSERIAIPYGKHTLASRMRWSGITAKPREMGFYKGIVPVMDAILKHKRNRNILRFVRTSDCTACRGARLNSDALSVKICGFNIADLASLQLNLLQDTLDNLRLSDREDQVAAPIISRISKRIDLLKRLGLAYLSLDRESTTLSVGESQRLRIAVQAGTGLTGILYIFDEPSVGLHPRDTRRLIEVLEGLRDDGNSVIVVEHEEEFIRRADWIIDIGPAAGVNGGRVLQNIDTSKIGHIPAGELRRSRTLSFFKGIEKLEIPDRRRSGGGMLAVHGATENNLKNVDVHFSLEALNVVTGVSGAGKSTLVNSVLGNFLRNQLYASSEKPGKCLSIAGWESISKVITIDQSPIGRTPRSNPATYTGLFDHVRDLFAALPASRARGWDKGKFSFNTTGGRCEACQGAGYQQIGMHFMGNVEVLCEECNGRRFHGDTLEITRKGKNIGDVLDFSVSEARDFFPDHARILRYLKTMASLGLGYLKLGQRSSTLSGGEAQRIKLATELARPQAAHTLYILDEPTTGLHQADVGNLLLALNSLVVQKNTVIVIEHHLGLIAAADWVVDLGPEGGSDGGRLLVQGTPEDVVRCAESHTGQALKEYLQDRSITGVPVARETAASPRGDSGTVPGIIQLSGVTTNNLRHIDVAIPRNQVTVITGVSGSGKSSLAFDTLFAEGQNRFMESFSTYARSQIGVCARANLDEATGLTPTLAVDQRSITANPRSTVGTMTGIYDLYRLLYSRVAATDAGETPGFSSLFSFNHQSGACRECDGLGHITVCDPEMLITNPEKSVLDGALDGTKTGRFYGDPFGQYVATLKAVGQQHHIDFSKPWAGLSEFGKSLALYGSDDEVYDVTWSYKRENHAGQHEFKGKWPGLVSLVNAEYERKHADHRGQRMLPLMKQDLCPSCHGTRLRPESLRFSIGGLNIAELSAFPVSAALDFFRTIDDVLREPPWAEIAAPLAMEAVRRLAFLDELGLSYLSIDRTSNSLSGGEAQRVRLAAQLRSGLTDVTYVLDEPTVGLHAADVGRLIMKMLHMLRQAGNTVVLVEHDRDVILSADHVIDLGPGAGSQGGRIVAEGTPQEIMHSTASMTGRYLSDNSNAVSTRNRVLKEGLSLVGACANNLKHLSVSIPSEGIVVVTGISGSGKTSLVYDVVYQSWERGKGCGCTSITGFEHFHRMVAVHQKPHFSGSTGTPATFTGILDRIRDLYAGTEDARRLHLGKKHFSFADKEGRCETCRGLGRIRVSMDFLSDVEVTCEQCKGKRYREEVLACRYQARNIADVLAMTAGEAAEFFRNQKVLSARLEMLSRVGLDYMQLGQPLDSLSGGEAQRLMLAAELAKPVSGKILYLFDEPATGLHFSDIEYLLKLFHQLADQGHTLLVIEHDPQIILNADWIIDLGPQGGEKGGYVVASGRLPDIIQNENSVTGRHLKNGRGGATVDAVG
ncbi:MAG: excinuclease ABC subunit UvrA [Acidobacteriia bacterium]|nr:excinuclease ABC subunit UvrA [Terriglobia bacterium]